MESTNILTLLLCDLVPINDISSETQRLRVESTSSISRRKQGPFLSILPSPEVLIPVVSPTLDTSVVDFKTMDAQDSHTNSKTKRRRVQNDPDKKYLCPWEGCDKQYSRAEHLNRHKQNRTDQLFKLSASRVLTASQTNQKTSTLANTVQGSS